ncbi:hypothetical protein AKJ09_00462 [Labilithrix luteola]|uniref:Outer membrane lipoprotein BamD-like domain-containing protein n=1 Tax=Labilithrix luteola TaxID=1391654 RepID=A0A0K1PJT4_9BACT|nr:hypothetical protein [Labilithrix luteola]AKU93798.1 hypothetical protein AKJ09_00462 [Labilithrix luteola]
MRSLLRQQPEDLPSDAKMQELATRLGPIVAPSTKSTTLVSGWRWLIVVAVAGAIVGMPIALRTQSRVDAVSASPSSVVTAAPVSVTPSAPAIANEQAVANAVPSISVDSLPTAAAERARPATVSPVSPASTCTNEIELVERADATLRAGDARRALELTREHFTRCPNGSFVQERERVAIEALALLGQNEEMRARAKAFETRFPSSPHVRRIRNLASSNPE